MSLKESLPRLLVLLGRLVLSGHDDLIGVLEADAMVDVSRESVHIG